MSELKNVVVIGLGYAGNTAAQALATALPNNYRVVAIQEYDFAYNPPASLRAATVGGWETKVTAPVANIFPKGSRHVVIAGIKVVELRSKSLRLEKPASVLGGSSEIDFEYAVVATGSTYNFPTRVPSHATTEAEVWQVLKEFQQDVKSSESILVVGGGATGVEFAAEVKSAYPTKTVTVVHSADRFFAGSGYKPKLGASIASQLKGKGVKVIYNAKVEGQDLKTGRVDRQSFQLSNGSSVEADFVFIGFGWVPNSDLVKAFDPSLVDEKGFVKVKSTLQLASGSGDSNHIFAIGDVNNVAEVKQAAFAKFQAPVAVANIISLIKSNTTKKEYSAAAPLALITSGPDGGAGQLFGFVIGSFLAKNIKSKSLMVPGWFSGYNVPVRA